LQICHCGGGFRMLAVSVRCTWVDATINTPVPLWLMCTFQLCCCPCYHSAPLFPFYSSCSRVTSPCQAHGATVRHLQPRPADPPRPHPASRFQNAGVESYFRFVFEQGTFVLFVSNKKKEKKKKEVTSMDSQGSFALG
jgi:hypothetical protein